MLPENKTFCSATFFFFLSSFAVLHIQPFATQNNWTHIFSQFTVQFSIYSYSNFSLFLNIFLSIFILILFKINSIHSILFSHPFSFQFRLFSHFFATFSYFLGIFFLTSFAVATQNNWAYLNVKYPFQSLEQNPKFLRWSRGTGRKRRFSLEMADGAHQTTAER